MTYKNQHLTRFAKCAGCAAKLDPAGLNDITGLLKPHKAVLSGIGNNEDASIYRISSELALVQTLDFITPIVDSAYHFGAIAAANALSDVFAMGAEPLNALNIVGFDSEHFELGLLKELLQGAKDKCDEAGAVLVGGHTIKSAELFFGLSVTGSVHPQGFLANNTARVGDILVLTKPLGAGILSTALKGGMLENELLEGLLSGMMSLNLKASRILREFSPSAMTDVTGFGLLGHAKEMLNSSICIEIYKDKVPFYRGVREKFALGLVPGGAYNNQKAISPFVKFDGGVNLADKTSADFGGGVNFGSVNSSGGGSNFDGSANFSGEFLGSDYDDILLFDPQTSGGLLCALPSEKAEFAVEKLQKTGINAAIIGICKALKAQKPFIRVV